LMFYGDEDPEDWDDQTRSDRHSAREQG
jgi:hypothetical protein